MASRAPRLQRQLTWSFVQTTFLTAIALEVLVVALFWLYAARSPSTARDMVASLSDDTQRLALLIDAPGIRAKAVQKWLTDQRYSIGGGGLRLGETWKREPVYTALVLPGGKVWGASPEDARLDPEVLALAGVALSGEKDPHKLGIRLPTTAVIGAAPVRDEKGKLLGTVAFRTPPLVWINPGATLVSLALVALVPALFSAVIGGIAGWVSARRLTRRFDAIALAADGWARGELQLRAPENRPDELGMLAQRLNRMARELSEALATRRELAAAEERNRLARDLHDTVKQQAFAAAMQTAAARARLAAQDVPGATNHLAETETLIKTMQADLAAVIAELRPAASGLSLTVRLNQLLSDWSRTSGMSARLTGSAPPLPEPVTRELVLLVQEALANVARHSGARTMELTLARSGELLTFTLTDDGAGFDPAQARAGLGLTSMRERAESLPGGTFSLASVPGHGTTITVGLKP
jgi:two-component system, NarL family, sensor histidine kinase LiaS